MASEESVKKRVAAASRPSFPANRRNLLRGGVAAIAALTALVAWFATDGGGNSARAPGPTSATPPSTRLVSTAELREAAATLGQPIYWAGRVAGRELELKELPEGGVQVLYLTRGAAAGSTSNTLTVGSYPVPDPGAALEAVAARPSAIVRHGRDGREVVTGEGSPTSVYFASPENSVQVEVYDPSPARAMSLALSGRVQKTH